MVTRSMAAPGACDSRSSSASVRSVRTSRIGAGSSSRRTYGSRVTSRRMTWSTAVPRSRRSSRVDSGSSSRVSTNDSGSRPSIGHSRSSEASNRSSSSVGMSGRRSSPCALACQTSAAFPSRAVRSAAGSAASSPSVFNPHCLNAATAATAAGDASPGALSPVTLGSAAAKPATRSRMPIGTAARAPASWPGSTIVRPGFACARTSAVIRVPATAT